MQCWTTKPFLRILIPFISGIILYPVFNKFLVMMVAILIIILLFGWQFLKAYQQFRLHSLLGIPILAIFLIAGYSDMYLHDIRERSDWFAKDPGEKQMIVEVSEPVKKKNNRMMTTAAVKYTLQKDQWTKASGNLVLYLPESLSPPATGSYLWLNASTKPIQHSLQASSFDYPAFMARRHIYHSCYPGLWQVKELSPGNDFKTEFIDHIRNEILSIMDHYIPESRENGLAKALLIGYRENLDKEIVNAYTNTGVIHVIAISGLHLALIYGILAFFMQPLNRKKKMLPFRAVFIISFLWVFSILCGASPSVLRSALMFTCLLAGEVLQKENYTANVLAASAFMLLCYDPLLLWDIGFQLSYAAVGSLLVYNKSINQLYIAENGILAFAWNSVSTSMAAQILTTPLVLYHFHQFPLLFILSNLIAVPLSGIILILLILLCLISPLALFAQPLARLVQYLAFIMNSQIERLSSISFALVNNMRTDIIDSIIFYSCIVLLTIWLRLKKPIVLLSLLVLILLWMAKIRFGCG